MRNVRNGLDVDRTQIAKEIFGARNESIQLRESLASAEQATVEIHRQAVSDRASVQAASERIVELRNEIEADLSRIQQFLVERLDGVGDAILQVDAQLRSDPSSLQASFQRTEAATVAELQELRARGDGLLAAAQVAESATHSIDTRIEQAFQLAVDKFSANDQTSAVTELSVKLPTVNRIG